MARKGLWQPLALATVLAGGFVPVWGVLAMWAAEVAVYTVGAADPVQQLVFLRDGSPLVLVNELGDSRRQEYRDLAGNPAPRPDVDHTGWLHGTALPAPADFARGDDEGSWGAPVRSFADGRNPATYWYFICDARRKGTGYFVGYDSASKLQVGFLGRAGFRDAPLPPDELFPFYGPVAHDGSHVVCTQKDYLPTSHPDERIGGRAPTGALSGWDVYVLGLDGKVYHADLQGRTVELAIDVPGISAVALGAGQHHPERGTPHHLAVRAEHAVLICDENGLELRRYPIPSGLRGQKLTFAETNQGEALMYWQSPRDTFATEVHYRIYWVARNGASREAAPSLPNGSRELPHLFGLALPSPAILGGYVAYNRPTELLRAGVETSYALALARALLEFRPALLVVLAVSMVLAILCYRRQVLYGVRGAERVVWPLFVLLLGLPGWVGYRFGRGWPVVEACATCGATVARDDDTCRRCAADFPGPALKGTEVFA